MVIFEFVLVVILFFYDDGYIENKYISLILTLALTIFKEDGHTQNIQIVLIGPNDEINKIKYMLISFPQSTC